MAAMAANESSTPEPRQRTILPLNACSAGAECLFSAGLSRACSQCFGAKAGEGKSSLSGAFFVRSWHVSAQAALDGLATLRGRWNWRRRRGFSRPFAADLSGAACSIWSRPLRSFSKNPMQESLPRLDLSRRLTSAVDFAASSRKRAIFILIVFALACFLQGIRSLPPTNRDESRFAQATKQMFETGDFIDIRYQDQPRYRKPIGIYWLQAAS